MNFEKIEKLKDLDNELIFEIIHEPFGEICKSIKSTPIPKTLEIITMLQCNIGFIKNGIFNLALDENYYGACILERALLEHFIKHLFLFVNYCHFKDDSAGINYYKSVDIKEYQNYYNNLKKSKHLKDETFICEIDSIINNAYDGYIELSGKNKKNIAEDYTFFHMLEYVSEKIKQSTNNISSILTNLPTDYTILSSFTHGGPHANRLTMFNAMNNDALEEKLYQICKKAFNFNNITLINTFIIAGQYDNKFLKFDKIIQEYDKKVLD